MAEIHIATTPPTRTGRLHYVICEFCECHTAGKATPEEAAEVWRQVPPDFSGEGKNSLRFYSRDASDVH
jgi:hypothetical protein